jgi:hypothetical protein
LTSGSTTVDQLVAILPKRWDDGRYALAYVAGAPWTPITLPVKAPTAAEILNRFDEARRWVEKFHRDSRSTSTSAPFRIEYRTIKVRNVGANEVPARIYLDSFQQLCALLGTTRDVQALDAIMEQTRTQVPELVPWVIDHPLVAINHRDVWEEVLASVVWIAARGNRALYLRQIDAEAVDTKFVERHKKLLDQLLTSVLPPERIDSAFTYIDFTRRLRFRPKPDCIRLRLLSPQPAFPPGISAVRLRTDELATLELDGSTVFVVENEISYLPFPETPSSIVIFGSGFGLTVLGDLPWLHRRRIVYWGDIDTDGFDNAARSSQAMGDRDHADQPAAPSPHRARGVAVP